MDNDEFQPPATVMLSGRVPWFINARFNGRHVDEHCASQWVGDHAGREDIEHVHFDRAVEVGRVWELTDMVLSRPLALFNSPYCSPGKLEIRRLVLSDINTRLAMEPGDRIRAVREIRVVDRTANRYLFQEIPLDALVGTFGTDGRVGLQVSRGSRFYMAYLGSTVIEPDEIAAMGYRQRFEALPDSQRVVTLRHVQLTPFNGGHFFNPAHFYVRKASDRNDWYWLYLSRDGEEDGLLPVDRAAELPALANGLLPSVYMLHMIGMGRAEDRSMDELIQTLYPADVLRLQHFIPGGGAGTEYALEIVYGYAFGGPLSTVRQVPATLMQHAEPLVKMISGVRSRTLLSALPHTDQALAWTFKGKAHGALELTGNDCWYCPPADPGVPHDNTGKTLRPCMYKAPEFSPVVIDKVMSGPAENPLQSTYVVLNARPTHYFKVEERGHQVGLQLCYQANGGDEVVVQPKDIEWYVLDGEGVMDAEGAFTPGGDQPFSVVLAIEKDQRRLYWAVIILPLPLKTAREFVTLSNRVA